MFHTNQKRFYSTLQNQNEKTVLDPPPVQDIEDFWSDLWLINLFNSDAPWVWAEENRMKNVAKMDCQDITSADLTPALRRLHNWKAVGQDQVQNFWIKHLMPLHKDL